MQLKELTLYCLARSTPDGRKRNADRNVAVKLDLSRAIDEKIFIVGELVELARQPVKIVDQVPTLQNADLIVV